MRERYLESMVQRALRHVILVSAHPRTLIQMTLQIGANHDHDPGCGNLPQADSVRCLIWLTWVSANEIESGSTAGSSTGFDPSSLVHIHTTFKHIDRDNDRDR